MGRRKALDEDDFPLKVDRQKIMTRNDEPMAVAESAELAEDLVERLNDDQRRRHEGQWTL